MLLTMSWKKLIFIGIFAKINQAGKYQSDESTSHSNARSIVADLHINIKISGKIHCFEL